MLYTEKMLFRQIRATLQSEGYDPRKVTEETRIKHDLDLHEILICDIADDLEKKFGVSIPDEELLSAETIGDIVAYAFGYRAA